MALTIAQDMPLEISFQAGTIQVPLGKIGLHRLNMSLVLPTLRVSMVDARWKKKFRPIGRNFYLSYRQPPWRTSPPPAPPVPFRSQLRWVALWKKKPYLWRTTRGKILPPPWTKTLSQTLLLHMTLSATMDEDQAQDDHSHPAPDSYRLTEDHLVLIFEMRRDLAEQQHRQSFFSK
jgi:hypothetical protein